MEDVCCEEQRTVLGHASWIFIAQVGGTSIYICKARIRKRQAVATLRKVSVRSKWVVKLIKDNIESKGRS
ncbi:hypothetical protein PUN28_018688 [Cardiocondyla obscurior]|uniref:Uncharacterized protein n=1 Tax=Cardiocondyla obscurior TaxID=286306 RepID=A0AAW2EHB8_9HYME